MRTYKLWPAVPAFEVVPISANDVACAENVAWFFPAFRGLAPFRSVVVRSVLFLKRDGIREYVSTPLDT